MKKAIITILFLVTFYGFSQSYLAKSVNGVNANSTGDITISSFGRNVDTIYKNTAKDSIVFTISGIRYAVRDSIGGGASLSGITSATATNTINNTNNKQRWQWNTIGADTAFVLESVSTTASSSLQNVFTVKLSGANATLGQTTKAGVFSNTHTGGGTNYGLVVNAIGGSTNTALQLNASGGSINTALDIPTGNIQMTANNSLNVNSNTSYFRYNTASAATELGGGSGRMFFTTSATSYIFCNSMGGGNMLSIMKPTVTSYGVGFGVQYLGGYLAETTSANTIVSSGGTMNFTGNTGLAGSFASYTPTNIMSIYGTNTNVGIGTVTPVASAALELSSTTKGFLPPRMTATQASAISSPAQGLMLFVTDTNGTFTSVGWWGYNGSAWEKLNN